MKMSGDSAATKNVGLALRTDRTLPGQVFTEGWGNFEFFDADWMRGEGFIQPIQRLLEIEGCQEAALVNLDYRDNGIEPHAFRIDLATTEWLSALGRVTRHQLVQRHGEIGRKLGRGRVVCVLRTDSGDRGDGIPLRRIT
jgi:hypothetical protein